MTKHRLHASSPVERPLQHAVYVKMVLAACILVGLTQVSGPPRTASAQDAAQTPIRSQAYLRDAITLSGILGAAHGTRYVCQGDGDQYWRQHMMDLLAIEAPERGALRDSMVSAFNSSFTRMRERYRRCTDRVSEEEAAYAAEGRDLANKMAASYFPKRPR